MPSAATRDELMAVAAASEIGDGEVAFIGTGLPMVAAYLAKATHAPNVTLVFESGIIDPRPIELATGVGDYRLLYGATKVTGTAYALGLLQAGLVDIGFLGTAEIDAHGNLNSTVIGPYGKPKVRLPGSGGANDIASMAKRFVTICRLDRKRFVQKLNYLTSPGFIDGPGARERHGLPGAGPARVITDKAIFGFDPNSRRMRIETVYAGVDPDTIQAEVGFALASNDAVHEAAAPSAEQLRLLRTVIDPQGVYVSH